MGVYILTVAGAILLSWIIKLNKDRKVHWIVNVFLLIVLIGGLSLIVGFRYGVGTDFAGYKRMFEVYKDYSWGDIFALKEPGIRIIVRLVAYFTDDYSWYMFVCAIITTSIPIIVLYRHSENFLLSVIIYLFVVYLAQCNAMRQTLAMSIIFAGYKYIKQKRFFMFLIFVLLGSIFHSSAFFCIPIYFIYTSKPSWTTTLIILFGTLLMRLSYDVIGNAVGFFQEGEFESTGYYQNSVSFLRIAAMIAPVIIIAPLKPKMIQEKSLAVNMLLANACVYFCMAGSAYFARLGMFTDMFLCMAIPSIFKKYGEKDKGFIVFITVLCYAIYFYANTTMAGNLVPYTSVLWG